MRIEIVVDDVGPPPGGQVSRDGGSAVAFIGWLPLLRIMEELMALPEALPPQRLGGQLQP